MEFDLTHHAQYMLERRAIRLEWVDEVVSYPLATEPDKEDPSLEHRLGRVAEYGQRVLRVVIDPKVKPLRIITAFWDRGMRNKL